MQNMTSSGEVVVATTIHIETVLDKIFNLFQNSLQLTYGTI